MRMLVPLLLIIVFARFNAIGWQGRAHSKRQSDSGEEFVSLSWIAHRSSKTSGLKGESSRRRALSLSH